MANAIPSPITKLVEPAKSTQPPQAQKVSVVAAVTPAEKPVQRTRVNEYGSTITY